MRHTPVRLLIGLAAAGAACLALARAPAAGEAVPAAAPEDHGWSAAADREAVWVGVAGCASSSCHHENGPKGAKRSEYDTWIGYDKHSRAFQVLYNDRSQRIARNLYGDNAKPATEQALCLKCHAAHDGVTDRGVGERFQLADGVSCESCHGAAEKWVNVHYLAGFKEKSLEEKAALGLRPTKDILHRAMLCTSCHVGTPDKEVNHDLIAAGHPRLAFELGGYHGIYNKHWDVNDDVRRYPDFQARLWSVGQLVSAKAALDLLAARAEGAEKGTKPWPEFSEYNCFACHKQLEVNSPRQAAGYGGRHPGNLPWGEWYLSPTNPLSGQVGMRAADDADPLGDLRKLMQSPSPDARKVPDAARGIVRRIDGVLGAVQPGRLVDGGRPRDTLERILAVGEQRAGGMSWDEAAQLYLALAALENELNDLDRGRSPPAVRERLEKMARDLQRAFPKDSDSPSQFRPTVLEADLRAVRGGFGD
jgi:hypothetical protein